MGRSMLSSLCHSEGLYKGEGEALGTEIVHIPGEFKFVSCISLTSFVLTSQLTFINIQLQLQGILRLTIIGE